MSEELLKIEGLSKSFGALKVVDEVSFVVSAGEPTALIGPNGAGKTTVFNLLSGAYRLTSGRIELAGEDLTTRPPRLRAAAGLARSFQNIRLMPHLSVLENVMLGQHARASSARDLFTPLWMKHNRHWREEARAMLHSLGLDFDSRQAVADLPYGLRKKVEIARALMNRPKLLLLDEPAAGLDTRETAQLRSFLADVAARQITLLVIEHDMGFVRDLCQHTIVLNFGRKIFDGPTSEVSRDPLVLEAYLGRDHQSRPVTRLSGAL